MIWLVLIPGKVRNVAQKKKWRKPPCLQFLKLSVPPSPAVYYRQSIYLLTEGKKTLWEHLFVAALAQVGWGRGWSQFLTTEQKAWSSFLLLRCKKGLTPVETLGMWWIHFHLCQRGRWSSLHPATNMGAEMKKNLFLFYGVKDRGDRKQNRR